jgi:(3S)-malyl-CoA thioesterase
VIESKHNRLKELEMSAFENVIQRLRFVRSALYVPASNIRALEKARGLAADMLIIDLEDAVPDDAKDAARVTAKEYVAAGVPGKLIAVRINGMDSKWHGNDRAELKGYGADAFVLPKVESGAAIEDVQRDMSAPLIAMIETPAGLYGARDIAAHLGVVGLIAGTNDIAAETGIRPGPKREGLELSLQMIVLAAAAAGKPAFDGVNNALDDMDGLSVECVQGRIYGFTGKTLIHPNQIAIANRCFAPGADEIEDARALIAGSDAGAQRFRGRMIEAMHVMQAKITLDRASRAAKDG